MRFEVTAAGSRLLPVVGPTSSPSPAGGSGVIDGETARRAARVELRRSEYHRDDPSLLQRGWNWVLQRITSVVGHAFRGQVADVLIVIIVVALVVGVGLLLRLAGRPRRTGTMADRDLQTSASAADHRRAAERHTGAEEWAFALREWLRACSAAIEERGLLAPKPGRTAAELARAGGARLPGAAAALGLAGNAFDEIWFADRTATADDAELGRRADAAVRNPSNHNADRPSTTYAVPR